MSHDDLLPAPIFLDLDADVPVAVGFAAGRGANAVEDEPAKAEVMTTSTMSSSPTQTIDSQQLLRGQRVLHILHDGALYQLRTTKSGKLILTK